MRYETRYVHKISPSEKDVGKPVDLSPTDLENKTKLASARDRLIAAGIVDEKLAGRTGTAGGWMLSVDEGDYSDARAKALP